MPLPSIPRRTVLASLLAAPCLPLFAQSKTRHRVGVIGHTGRGNFGHGLDKMWLQMPETEIVGVADGDTASVPKAVSLLKLDASQGFSDYRKMLRETRPDVVAVCPRHVDQHAEMCLAAIEAGARGLYVEKPFVRSPAEADAVLAAAAKTGCKIAVAHRNRWHPALPHISQLIEDGRIGKILEIRGRGKGDRRGGPEDLWVLGSHVLNLFDYLGGGVEFVSAGIYQDGVPLGPDHPLTEAKEGMGLIGGNEVRARYRLANGLAATFDSVAENGLKNHSFGLRIIGSEGVIQIGCDRDPLAYLIPGNYLEPAKSADWIPITAAGLGEEENEEQRLTVRETQNHIRPGRDLIASLEDPDRRPLCDGEAGRQTVEMICGVYASHLQGEAAVAFPLKDRAPSLDALQLA